MKYEHWTNFKLKLTMKAYWSARFDTMRRERQN